MTDELRRSNEGGRSSGFSAWLGRNGWNLGVLLTVILAAAAGLRFLGGLEERVKTAHEGISRLDYQMTALGLRLDNQMAALDNAKDKAILEIRASVAVQDDPSVFVDGRLTSGYDMGVNISGGLTDWVAVTDAALCMKYPSGQQWGAVFITAGRPSQPPRPGRDLSTYRALLIEARGERGGESVLVGLKDNTDPDDGSETKVRLSDLTTNWQPYEISLARFRTADLTRLYVVTEFVFEEAPMKICVRRVEFLR